MIWDARRELCLYCVDREVLEGWKHIGGTIGETHYVCHRKRCQRAHVGYLIRAEGARRRAKAEREAKR